MGARREATRERHRLEMQLRASLRSDPNRTVAVLAAALGDHNPKRPFDDLSGYIAAIDTTSGTDSAWLDRRIEEIAARGR